MKKMSKLLQIAGLSLISTLMPMSRANAEEASQDGPIQMNFYVNKIQQDFLSEEFYTKPNHGIWAEIAKEIEETYKAQGINLKFNFTDTNPTTSNQKNITGEYTIPESFWPEYLRRNGCEGIMNGWAGPIKRKENISWEEADKKAYHLYLRKLVEENGKLSGRGSQKERRVTIFSDQLEEAIKNHGSTNAVQYTGELISHEAGHALGLEDIYGDNYLESQKSKTDRKNIMYGYQCDGKGSCFCPTERRILTPEQIQIIKQQTHSN